MGIHVAQKEEERLFLASQTLELREGHVIESFRFG
jgi:hypothetical protein